MSLLHALWLGLVEGITEFLPVSSTGHLIIVSNALGLHGDFINAFNVAVQSGAILAVVILRRERFARLMPTQPDGALDGKLGLWHLFLITAPALILGFFFRHKIEERLFEPLPVALAFAVGGLAILLLDKERKGGAKAAGRSLESLSSHDAILIGLVQCLALWPGMSRSGCTIIGALFLGFRREAATELSFLAAVPVLLAATGYEVLKHRHDFGAEFLPFAVGWVAAFISACLAIQGFLALLKRAGLKPFGWYRIAAAPLVYLWFR
jgi:undecaprenyl-diphosphatase